MSRFQNGSIIRQKRRTGPDTWVFRWYEGEGETRKYRKRIVGTVVNMPLRRDAERAVLGFRTAINSGVRPAQSVAELAQHYKKHELVAGKKSPSSIYVNGNFLDLYIVPRWGESRLENVRTVEVEDWLDKLPYAPATRAKIRNIMSAIFNHAIRREWAFANPISKVRCSAKRLRTPDVLTPDEFRALLGELEPRHKAMVVLAGSTGLRRGELFGLKWEDVSLTRREVTVRRSCVRNIMGEPKTEASRKPVPLPKQAAKELAAWRRKTLYGGDGDFLFPSMVKDGKQPLTPDMVLKRTLRPAAKRAGIVKKLGWHTFRHSLATNLRGLGVDVKVAQEMLRHANSRITMDIYTQAVSADKQAASALSANLLLPPRRKDDGGRKGKRASAVVHGLAQPK